MDKIFEAEFRLDQSFHQKHIPIHIDLKDRFDSITIQYQYSPVVEDNMIKVLSALSDAQAQGSIDPFTTADHLRNLITPSVRYNDRFIGANHSFDQMEIVLGEASSVGFNSVEFDTGLLEIIMSCHAIISDDVILNVSVYGKEYQEEIVSYNVELHSHTNHSDATFTVDELLASAEKRTIDVLGITDHNTMTSYDIAKQSNRNLLIIPGIEYTTFYGHFLCLGNPIRFKHKDFTCITKDNIFEFLMDIKHEDTLLIMAHPFDTGSPICTGCKYEYDSSTYGLFDAIEVWNGDLPHTESNDRALTFYKRLLLDNPSVVMTCGRDWHNEIHTGTVTRLKVFTDKNVNYQSIIQAVKSGRSELQYGFAISSENILPYGLTVDIQNYLFEVVTDEAQIKVDSNLGYLDVKVTGGYLKFDDNTAFENLQWIIIEKYMDDKLVAIGNPIFNGGDMHGE